MRLPANRCPEVVVMSRLLLVAAALALAAFAPAPFASRENDPDRAIARHEKDLQDGAGQSPAALEACKKKLAELLAKRQAELRRRGRTADADALRDRAVLLASVNRDRPLGKTSTAALLRKATAQGKYRRLLRVLYMPGDQAGFGQFKDYGSWAGNSYNGENNLPTGYWVYSWPRWYIWGEVTPP
jgi:hypothetical protein